MALNLSPGRKAWLEKLRDSGLANRARGRVGIDCMRAGWTDWLIRMPDGREMPGKEYLAIPYEERPRNGQSVGEIITPAGLAVLNAAREAGHGR